MNIFPGTYLFVGYCISWLGDHFMKWVSEIEIVLQSKSLFKSLMCFIIRLRVRLSAKNIANMITIRKKIT